MLRSVKAFLLNNNIGRGLLIGSILASGALVFTSLLSLLPSSLAGLVLQCVVIGAFTVTLFYYVSLRAFGKVLVKMGTGEDLKRVFASMCTAHRAPRPPIWAYNCHLQFVPWIIYNLVSSWLAPLGYETDVISVSQLIDKTKPESSTNTRSVDDSVVISYFPPITNCAEASNKHDCMLPLDAPAIFVDPGLTCTAQDIPGSSIIRLAMHRGFRVVVMERRAHARPLTKPRWNLFGDADDMEQIYNDVRKKLPDAPFFWVGVSSGSKLPIEAMGKFDKRRKDGDVSAPEFVATACLCPGYNLETCFMGFGFPYSKMCLSSVKSKFLAENEDVLRSYNAEAYDKAMKSTDLQSLLSHVAPFAGYPSAEKYFENENPVLFASLITTPTLIINSLDDPCTVAKNAFGTMPGSSDGLTFVDMIEKSPCGMLLMSSSGSHCPFLDGTFFPFVHVPRAPGRLIIASWADFCILEFFEGYLKEYRGGR